MIQKLIFSLTLITLILFSQLANAQDSKQYQSQIKDDEIKFYVVDAETKEKLEKLLAKIGLTKPKIIITPKEDYIYIKSELINYSEGRCGGFYKGKIGKNLDIHMELILLNHESEDYILNQNPSKVDEIPSESQIKLYGYYSYDKYKKPIEISGNMKHDLSFEIEERLNGKVTGYFKGTFDKNLTNAKGVWTSSDAKRNFDFSLKKIAKYICSKGSCKHYYLHDLNSLENIEQKCSNSNDCIKHELLLPGMNEQDYPSDTDFLFRYIEFDEDKYPKYIEFIDNYPKLIGQSLKGEIEKNCNLKLSDYVMYEIKQRILFFTPKLISIEEIKSFSYLSRGFTNFYYHNLLYNHKTKKFEFIDLSNLINFSGSCKIYFYELADIDMSENILDFTFDKEKITFIYDRPSVGDHFAEVYYKDLMKGNCIPKNSPLLEIMDENVKKIKPDETTKNLKPNKEGLIVYYSFDEIVDSYTIKDNSGNGLDLVTSNHLNITLEHGISGKAVKFDRTYYLKAKENPLANMDEFTVSLWFKTKNPSDNIKLVAAAWWAGGNNASGWNIGTHYPEFWADNREGSLRALPDWKRIPSVDFIPDEWNHLVVTVNKKEIREYINGKLSFKGPSTGRKVGVGRPMTVGSWDGGFTLVGLLDELKIYNRSLSEQEIISLYKSYVKGNNPKK